MPGTVLALLRRLTYLALMTTLRGRYYVYFIDFEK